MKIVYTLRGASSAVVRATVAWPCLKKVRLRFINGLSTLRGQQSNRRFISHHILGYGLGGDKHQFYQ